MAGALQGAVSNMVGQGPIMYLAAGNTNSYPGSGTTWSDLTVNNYDATLFNTPTHTAGDSGYFTFASASVEYATVTGTPMSTTAYSKCIWFYQNTSTDNNLVSSDTGGHYMFFGGTNRLYCGHTAWTGFPTTYQSTGTFSTGTWYFVCLTFSTAVGMTLYKNGSFDSSYTAQKTGPTGGQVNLACYSAGGNLLNGRIAQVWIWNRVLSPTEQNRLFEDTRALYGV